MTNAFFATKQRMFGVFAIDEILRTLCHPAGDMWELSSPVLRLAEGGSVRMCNFKKVRRWTSQNCNWILSVNEEQVESRWVTCAKISRGSGSVRMWESQGGRQRVASGRPTERTRSPGSLTELTHPADSAFELKTVTTLVNEYGRGIMER